MNNEQAKTLLEALKPMQNGKTEPAFPCPRCGQPSMDPIVARNALSRRADVYVCSWCGLEEAMLDAAGKPPLPFADWAMARSFQQAADSE